MKRSASLVQKMECKLDMCSTLPTVQYWIHRVLFNCDFQHNSSLAYLDKCPTAHSSIVTTVLTESSIRPCLDFDRPPRPIVTIHALIAQTRDSVGRHITASRRTTGAAHSDTPIAQATVATCVKPTIRRINASARSAELD